jgi:hypothetical protein
MSALPKRYGLILASILLPPLGVSLYFEFTGTARAHWLEPGGHSLIEGFRALDRLATLIQQQLAAVGLAVELRSYDWGTFFGDIKAGRFQMFSLSWVGIKSPDIFRYAFHSASIPPVGANRGRFTSRLADRLIERAQASDWEMQADIYRRLQHHLAVSVPPTRSNSPS